MNTYFTISMLSAAAFAQTRFGRAEESAFIGFCAQYNKQYGSVEDLDSHLEVYLSNQANVDYMNETNTGVSFKMNETGDLTDAEFREHLGLKMPAGRLLDGQSEDQWCNGEGSVLRDQSKGRHLDGELTINWVELGNVTPVKQQGNCGSCWAFAATTAQEAMQSIQTGNDPVRLSEQEAVDCVDRSAGCMGGWMENYWQWSKDGSGSQPYETYPYQGKEKSCRYQDNDKISKAASCADIKSVDDMKMAIQDGPMTIAVAADNWCWRYYDAGVLSSANNCPSSEWALDHGVVIVGLHTKGYDIGETVCRRATWRERRNKQCSGDDEELSPNKRGNRPNRRCCRWVQDPYESDLWIIQNSWGKYWGDEGFIYLAVEEGNGVSGMNIHPQQMYVDPSF